MLTYVEGGNVPDARRKRDWLPQVALVMEPPSALPLCCQEGHPDEGVSLPAVHAELCIALPLLRAALCLQLQKWCSEVGRTGHRSRARLQCPATTLVAHSSGPPGRPGHCCESRGWLGSLDWRSQNWRPLGSCGGGRCDQWWTEKESCELNGFFPRTDWIFPTETSKRYLKA